MAHGITIINKSYIDYNKLIKVVEKISNELGYNFYPSQTDETKIDISFNSEVTFNMYFYEKESAIEINSFEFWGGGYFPVLTIAIIGKDKDEDIYTVPFIKAFLKEYPNFIVANDNEFDDGGDKSLDHLLFTKADVEAFKSNVFYETFYVAPKK